jgi:hypothetical protein
VSRFRLHVYPNPTKNNIWVEGVVAGTYICRLYSPDGRLFREMLVDIPDESEYPFSVSLDLTGITAGVYVLYVLNGKSVYSEKNRSI